MSVNIRRAALPALLLSAGALGACAHVRGDVPPPAAQAAAPEQLQPAALATEPPPRIEVVAVPTPLPLPGQLQRVESASPRREAADPRARVSTANSAARMEPVSDGFLNAMQVWPYANGALYQVYTAPGHVTDIALQPGEKLAGTGPVAAGDTARWIIGDTTSGAGADERVHILVKPTRADLRTNLVINTDRRTYLVELRATPQTWMASVSWSYPEDQLLALRRAGSQVSADQPIASGLAVEQLRFDYTLRGDRPAWRPVRVFDDGRQVYVEFPAGIEQGEMPPLFVVGTGNGAELVNYRVRGRYMIVDRLFAAAELRLGTGRRQDRVRIERAERRAGR